MNAGDRRANRWPVEGVAFLTLWAFPPCTAPHLQTMREIACARNPLMRRMSALIDEFVEETVKARVGMVRRVVCLDSSFI